MGFLSACALGTGTMIGAGIFALSGEVAGVAGPAAVLSYALAGLAAAAQALSFAELASARPTSGGPYVYVRDFLGPAAGALAGWQLWLGTVLSASFYAVGFARYLAYFVPHLPEWPGGTALILLLAVLHGSGRSAAAAVQNLSVAVLLAVLGGLVALGAPRVDPAFWSPFLPYGWGPVVQSVPWVFVSYLGFDAVAQAGGAFVRPHVTVPRAMLASVALVTLLYCAVVAVSTGIVHYQDLAQSATPLAEVARRLVGRPGGFAVAAGGLLATLSSANGAFIAAAELTAAMARDGLLPRALGDRQSAGLRPPLAGASMAGQRGPASGPPQVRAPAPALPEVRGPAPTQPDVRGPSPASVHLLTGLLAGLGVLGATASGGLVWLARGTGLLHLVPFLLIPLAQLAARRRADHRPSFRAPGGWLSPLVAMGSMLLVLRQVTWHEASAALLLTLPGLGWYVRVLAGRPGPPPGPGAWPAPGRAGPSTAQRPGPPGKGA